MNANIIHPNDQKSSIQSKDPFFHFFQDSKSGSLLFDSKGVIQFCNPALEKISGIPMQQIIGKSFWDFLEEVSPARIRSSQHLNIIRQQIQEIISSSKSSFIHQNLDFEISTNGMDDRRMQFLIFSIQEESGEYLGCITHEVPSLETSQNQQREQFIFNEALRDTASVLTSTLDFNEVLDRILENIERVVPHDATNIMLIKGDIAQVVRSRGYDKHGLLDRIQNMQLKISDVPNLQKMISKQEIQVIRDVVNDPQWVDQTSGRWIRSYAGAPIVIKGKTVGFINLDSLTPNFFNNSVVERLGVFADQAAIAIENAKLFDEIQTQARNQNLLNQISKTALAAPNVELMLQSVADELRNLFHADNVLIMLGEQKNNNYKAQAQSGSEDLIIKHFCAKPSFDAISQAILANQKPLLIQDVSQYDPIKQDFPGQFPHRSIIGLPLVISQQKIGIAIIFFLQPQTFLPADAMLAEQAANQVTLAAVKARLLDEERNRSVKLSRTIDMISALSQVGARIDRVSDFDKLLEILGFEIRRLGFHCMVCLRKEDTNSFFLRYVTLEEHLVRTIEQLIQKKLNEVTINAEDQTPDQELFQTHLGKFKQDAFNNLSSLIPPYLHNLFPQIGITKQTRLMIAPMLIEDQMTGFLTVWGNDLIESDLPAINLFAKQVAIALENAHLYSIARQQAIRDDLTGLYNRRGFIQLGVKEIDRAVRFNHPLTILMLDIDHFKQVNDQFGHAVGDQVLNQLANRCRKFVRDVDLVGRIGGEEFAILIIENDAESASQIADRLRIEIAHPAFRTDGGDISITVSIGLAQLSKQVQNLEQMTLRADQMLYKAKSAGRNCVYYEK
jgi:diguanylate cyclase (GGDEF)-like protein